MTWLWRRCFSSLEIENIIIRYSDIHTLQGVPNFLLNLRIEIITAVGQYLWDTLQCTLIISARILFQQNPTWKCTT